MVRQTVEVWTLLMMPMFVTLETSLLAGLENTGKNWKSLLALPAPRWTVYVSKLVVTISLLWAAHAVLIAGTIGSGRLLKLTVSGLESRKYAFESICCADAEGVGVSSAGRGNSALGEFEMAQLYGGNGLRHVRDDHGYLCRPIKGNRVLVSLVSADPCGIGRRGRQDRITAVAVVGAIVAATIGCWGFVKREIG